MTLIGTDQLAAQTLRTLYSFTGDNGSKYPEAGLIISGDTLYGTTMGQDLSSWGTAFAVNIDGTDFTNLYSFTDGSDGAYPVCNLFLSGKSLYGTTEGAASSSMGTVFTINTNGSGFSTLYGFTGDQIFPVGGVVCSGNRLFGTAEYQNGGGSIYAVNTNGTDFNTLYSFPASDFNYCYLSGLILSGNTLYGQMVVSDTNTVFSINTNGTDFTNLYSFICGGASIYSVANLILSGDTLYGTSYYGGANLNGSLFSIKTNGIGFTTLYSFTGGSDGAEPSGNLALSGNTIYGTTVSGGNFGAGTAFSINTNGTGFTTLYSFTGGNDGSTPAGGLVLSSNTLYGTTYIGGTYGYGTVFSIIPSLTLKIATFGTQSILFWPASATNYVLQTTTNLSSSNWITISNGISVIAVTLTNNSTAAYFRLHQQ